MQRLLMFLLTVLAGLAPAAANAWWQADWQYRKQITVDTTPQGAPLGGSAGRSPLLVRLHTGNFTFDGISEKGADIRFVAADDQTVLNHQLEAFDPLLGIALIWVDVPELADGQRQDIWMYYGNQKAPASANGQLTFDPNYTLVYHFDGAAGAAARHHRLQQPRPDPDHRRGGRRDRPRRAVRRRRAADAAREPLAGHPGRRFLHVQRLGAPTNPQASS